VAFSYASGASFAVDAPALGLKRVASLCFSVSVYVGIGYGPGGYDFTNARVDVAPDANDEGLVPMWRFAAQPLAAADFRATPARPQAGKAFALTMRVQRSDTGALLARGNVTYSLRAGGKRVPVRTSRFVGRRATCLFDVPTGTTGRRFRAAILVAAQGAVVTRSLSGRVG
jgi:hypothetical protein